MLLLDDGTLNFQDAVTKETDCIWIASSVHDLDRIAKNDGQRDKHVHLCTWYALGGGKVEEASMHTIDHFVESCLRGRRALASNLQCFLHAWIDDHDDFAPRCRRKLMETIEFFYLYPVRAAMYVCLSSSAHGWEYWSFY